MVDNSIYGQDFMFYIECQTLTEDLMLPICEAKSVQLQFNSDISEATKGPSNKWKSFYYGRNSYTLNLDGLIIYSDEDIQQTIIAINNALLVANNKLVSIGGKPVSSGSGYFCLENALFDWKVLKWAFNGISIPMKWSGEVLVSQLGATFSPNALVEFSTSLQGNGEPKRFHTPAPTNLRKESQTNTLPTEDAGAFSIAPVQQGSTWLAGVRFMETYLPSGNFSIDTGHNYTIQIGDTLNDIAKGLAAKVNASPSLNEISAYADDDTLYIVMSANQTVTGTYTDHTTALRSVGLVYDCEINYDFYRLKIEQGANTWYVDVVGKTPTIILPVGTYTISVSGMGQDLQYSDYSETTTITIN